jgi:hypothetical protein
MVPSIKTKQQGAVFQRVALTFWRVSMCSTSPSFWLLTALSFTLMDLFLNSLLMLNTSFSPTSRPLGSFSSTLREAALESRLAVGGGGWGHACVSG